MPTRRQFRLLLPEPDHPSSGSLVVLGNGAAIAEVGDDRPYLELNPDTTVISAPQSFWSHVEVEYKLEAHASRRHCLEALTMFRSAKYSLSEVWNRTSYERYRRYTNRTGDVFHLAVLGRRGWRQALAIKYKFSLEHTYPTGFHVRGAFIGPYAETAATRLALIQLHCTRRDLRMRALPVYYSNKARRIALHHSLGIVFCLSFGFAKPLSTSLKPRSQFEIEYWSRVAPVGTSAAVGNHLLYRREFVALAEAFREYLRRRDIAARPSDLTRVSWLEGFVDANS